MDLKNFFELFTKGGKYNYSNLPGVDMDSPIYKVGMFVKLMCNGSIFSNTILEFLSKSPDFKRDDSIRVASQHMLYHRSFYWIKDLDIESKEWQEALLKYSKRDIKSSVTLLIKFLEKDEEYEKCAFLKKILDFLKDS